MQHRTAPDALLADLLDGRDLVSASLDHKVVLGTTVEHLLFGLVDPDGHVERAAGGQGSQLGSRSGPGDHAWM